MKTIRPRLLTAILVTAVLFIAGATPRSLAQSSQFFLKFDGVEGESVVQGHEKEIDAFSFNLGVNQSGLAKSLRAGAVAGRPQFLPVMIYKNVDISSPALFLACATGQVFKTVQLKAARRNGESELQQYLTITLTDVVVSSFNDQAADGSATVLETISLNYGKIEISYRPQKSDGSLGPEVKAGFDLRTNTAF